VQVERNKNELAKFYFQVAAYFRVCKDTLFCANQKQYVINRLVSIVETNIPPIFAPKSSKVMKNKIQLNGVRFYAFHGVSQQERTVGNRFTVDLEVSTDFTKAMADDDLGHTIDYAALYALLKTEMEQPSDLLEHVGGRILARLAREFPAVSSFRLKIAKQVPPIGADLKECAVVMEGLAEEIRDSF
jgi:dihydroneopterin aldolase